MRNIDPVRAMEVAQERLIAQSEVEDLKRRKGKAFAARFARVEQTFEKFEGGTPTGEEIKSTLKEVKLLEAEEEEKFLRKLRAYKGIGERPRLVTYALLKKTIARDPKPWWQS